MWKLIVRRLDGMEETLFPLDGKLVSVGRSSQCDLVLADKSVSSLHANLLRKPEGWVLMDLDSRNGTFVNNERIKQKALSAGDEAGIGGYRLLLTEEEHLNEETAATLMNVDCIAESQLLVRRVRQSSDAAQVSQTLEALDVNLAIAHRRYRQFQSLLALAEVVNQPGGSAETAGALLKAVLKATGLSRGAVVAAEGAMAREALAREGFTEGEWRAHEIGHYLVNEAGLASLPILSVEPHAEVNWPEMLKPWIEAVGIMAVVPFRTRDNRPLGALYLERPAQKDGVQRDAVDKEFLRLIGFWAGSALELRRLMEQETRRAAEMGAARERDKYEERVQTLERENRELAKGHGKGAAPLLGASPVMQKLLAQCERVAAASIPVLVTGPTGTGKSLLAQWMHVRSDRRDHELITIDCASIPSELLEAELFGYEKGAFTGAHDRKPGRIERAQNSTLFLDEIGDMSLPLQAKLLQFLQEGRFVRLGGNEPIHVDARIIAATNRDLPAAIREKRFREDLYYRLKGVTLEVPSLRQRGTDSVLLANAFLEEAVRQNRLKVTGFTAEARQLILHHAWPGNIRELRNAVFGAAVLCDADLIRPQDLNITLAEVPEIKALRLSDAHEEVDRKLITYHLLANHYHLSQTAEALGTDRGTLRRLMARYNIAGKQRKNGEADDE